MRLRVHSMWWPAIGGLVVGLGGWVQPRALGVGYDVIGDLLAHRLATGAALGLLSVKLVIWAVALGSGTSGGVLAPLLMIGAGLGSVLGVLLPGDPSRWALVCMAATLGGTMRAPLTAAAFAFGLTHDVNALLPAIMSCAIAYGFSVLLMPRSILTEKIARRGGHVFREYGIDPLERQFVEEVMNGKPVSIPANLAPSEVQGLFFGPSQSHRAYPVVDSGRFVGFIDRAALEAAAAPESISAAHLACATAEAIALPHDTCRAAAASLAAQGLERLAVVDARGTRKLLGIISRSDLIKISHMVHEEEHRRERPLDIAAHLRRWREGRGVPPA
jgi:CBS domain-containing protein